jgi:5'-nucleotidase
MQSQKPTILVTNDDGITAPGIKVLIELMRPFGNIVVVAPDSPQSAMGHAVTIAKPIRLDKVNLYEGVEMYQCSGTPVDCVKIAVNVVLHRKPDLVVSGINHGSNASINVMYSGTMSAAIEGALEGIPSIGFSLCNHRQDACFEHVKPFVTQIVSEIMKNGLSLGTTLNVNFPDITNIKGIKICRQGIGKWQEKFDKRIDPQDRPYYWLSGDFKVKDEGEDSDEQALAQGYVSIVPTHFDFTAYNALAELNTWEL